MKLGWSRRVKGWGVLLGGLALAAGCAGKSQGVDANTAGAGGTGAGSSGAPTTAGNATAGDTAGRAGAATQAGGAAGQSGAVAGYGGASGGAAPVGGAAGAVASNGGVGGSQLCNLHGCGDSSKYCRIVTLNGGVRLNECQPFPTSCRTCACAKADFAKLVSEQSYPCTFGCSDPTGAVADDETSDSLILYCMGA